MKAAVPFPAKSQVSAVFAAYSSDQQPRFCHQHCLPLTTSTSVNFSAARAPMAHSRLGHSWRKIPVGFEMVDLLADAEGLSMNTVNFKALFGKGLIGHVPVMLAKPQTSMNASDESVAQIVSFYKIPPEKVLVVYKDIYLPFGTLRLLPKGGYGGHNGMRSIIEGLKGNSDFPRLRIGIGRPPEKMDRANYILSQFSKQEHEQLDSIFRTGLKGIRMVLFEGVSDSGTFVNTPKD
ncbi:hypothetical protein Bca52824_012977 [Brassica carinata]|uniref:peptidyl-tRNA hydrolase n=1 Tax=Brassica carinata TaxID=52824 RepID=A0A8X8B0V4_BRACI|nr:hypothetical protein Bca52824_012977 [Brassica carinata]